MQVIVVTLPGLFVPFLGGVLIDRYDRRYLGIALDFARGIAVLTIAYLAWKGHLDIWHLYVMTLITGTGSAMYWACVNALVQEVMPPNQFTGANAAVLIGVQSGMLMAGAFVGFIYDTIGIAGILAIDGATYFVSAFCLYQMRRGYVSPRPRHAKAPTRSREYSEATEATALALESGGNPEVAEAGLSLSVFDDLKEGFAYLKKQPQVLALGITHATMMAGVVSANVILVALANDVLHAGARGLGYLEGGWAIGAITGGLLASQLNDKTAHVLLRRLHRRALRRTHRRPVRRLRRRRRHHSSHLRILPRRLRRRRAIHINDDRPAPFHGPHAILDRHRHHRPPNPHELLSRLGRATHQPLRRILPPRPHVRRRRRLRHPRPPTPVAGQLNEDRPRCARAVITACFVFCTIDPEALLSRCDPGGSRLHGAMDNLEQVAVVVSPQHRSAGQRYWRALFRESRQSQHLRIR